MTLLAPTLEMFFCERLMNQREASPHTIAGYRDTMRLLLTFANQQSDRVGSQLPRARGPHHRRTQEDTP
jgi:integrase/recombinase XerD